MAENSAMALVASQSDWYAKKAQACRATYWRLKATQIAMTAAIPVSVVFNGKGWVQAVLGALVGIAEGILQMGRYHENWLLYRATREALKREDLLYAGGVGPYAGQTDPRRVYIERADSILSGEHTKWLQEHQAPSSKSETVS